MVRLGSPCADIAAVCRLISVRHFGRATGRSPDRQGSKKPTSVEATNAGSMIHNLSVDRGAAALCGAWPELAEQRVFSVGTQRLEGLAGFWFPAFNGEQLIERDLLHARVMRKFG
jgi:hypothetical protein